MHGPASAGISASFDWTPINSQLTSLLMWQECQQSAAIPFLVLSVRPQGPGDLYIFHRFQTVCVY